MRKPAEDWLSYAEIDYQTIEKLLDDEFLTPSAAFHCHQCTEKLLKSLLEFKGEKIPKTHDLFVLLTQCKVFFQLDLNVDVIAMINDVYIDSRYPGDTGLLPDGKPSIETINMFFELTRHLKDKVISIIQSH